MRGDYCDGIAIVRAVKKIKNKRTGKRSARREESRSIKKTIEKGQETSNRKTKKKKTPFHDREKKKLDERESSAPLNGES